MRRLIVCVAVAATLAAGCGNGGQHRGPAAPYIVAALFILPILGIGFLAYRHYTEPTPAPVEPL